MNVLHLRSATGIYGAEKVILELISGFSGKRASLELAVMTGGSEGGDEFVSEARERGCVVHPITSPKRFSTTVLGELAEIVGAHNIDVVHTHDYKSQFYGLLLKRKLAVKVVGTFHGFTGNSSAVRIYEFLQKLSCRFLDSAVAVSTDVATTLIGAGVVSSKIRIITNGIDSNRFVVGRDQALAHELDCHENNRVFTCVGRLSREKGQKLLVQAFNELYKSDPDARLLLVGDGPDRVDIEMMVEKLGIGGAVRVLGYRSDVPRILSLTDVYVSPSLTEGTPVSILEAMASGKAIIATRVGGVPSVLGDDAGALICENDCRALFESMSELAESPCLRKRYGEAALTRVRNYYSGARVANQYFDLYSSVIGNDYDS